MKHVIAISLIIVCSVSLFAQENSLKEEALQEFKNEHYDNAILLLEKALEESKNDPEIYYYLGFFNHYRAYDSRPLNGYDYSYSEKIFEYLTKAIELNPNYGDAKYFYGAECSGNAFLAMQNYDLDKLKHFYKLAYDIGAYPAWLVELGKNMLNSCDSNAILFAGGNTDFDICSYLQLHQDYRTDVTVIPIGNIDRPWYVKFLREGLEGGVKKIELNLTDYQIYDIHPYKWDTTEVEIPISKMNLKKYGLDGDYIMYWSVAPDLTSNRDHSKIKGEEVKKRTYLSPQRAILLKIVEDNLNSRPIYFSNMTNNVFFGGLNEYFTNCGLVSELTPLKTDRTEFENDINKIEILVNDKNFMQYSTIVNNDIPRISGVVFGYHNSLLILAEYYNNNDQKEKITKLKDFFVKNLAIGYNENYENAYLAELERLEESNK
jgi:hypothetical protein